MTTILRNTLLIMSTMSLVACAHNPSLSTEDKQIPWKEPLFMKPKPVVKENSVLPYNN